MGFGGAERSIETVGESLQIDIGRVYHREELFTGLLRDIARSDGHVLDALLTRRLRNVNSVLEEDDGVVVGVGDGARPRRLCGVNDGLRRGFGLHPIEAAGFRNVPILAELTREVTAGVPNDSTGVPGRKWFRGFFSIGSMQKPEERP